MSQAAAGAAQIDGFELLKPQAQSRISSIAGLADCEIRIGQTVFSKLHKVILAADSAVLRAMIESVQDCSTITLHDDTPQQVGLLISLIYDRRMENLTREAVDSALKICRKYDLPQVFGAAEAFILNAKLYADNFVFWLGLATSHQLQPAIARCVAFAQMDDNLQGIMRRNRVKWLDLLNKSTQLKIVLPALMKAYYL